MFLNMDETKKTYVVSYYVTGEVEFEVEATNEDEAEELALEMYENGDGHPSWVIDGHIETQEV
jgi:hypothetical protein